MIWIKHFLLKYVELPFKLNLLHGDVQSKKEISWVPRLKLIFITLSLQTLIIFSLLVFSYLVLHQIDIRAKILPFVFLHKKFSLPPKKKSELLYKTLVSTSTKFYKNPNSTKP